MLAEIEKQKVKFKVTLLGTGCPNLTMARFGNSTLVEIEDEKFLFDTGRGATLRLHQLNIMPGMIDKVFFTHLHSDHLTGFPDVWLSGVIPTLGKRAKPMEIWGPVGTKKMAEHLEKAFTPDIEGRIAHGTIHPEGAQLIAYEIEEGVVYNRNGIQIIAFIVDHGTIKPCYGYRINYAGHSLVISGDTCYNENLIHHSKDADVIIHEVAAAKIEGKDSKTLQHIMEIHTTPEQAGKVFSQIKPKLAVYSHIVLLGGLSEEEADLIGRTKTTYSGPVIVGEDLMTIEIGDELKVENPLES
ncbi:MBL fold metallo-hydrolase [Neobacillus vireti]|uniref:MBL fold metallo-hydrolase n=1 Tax=Neobacillus vireti TaxID=220686 RepID=UPI002FFEAB50